VPNPLPQMGSPSRPQALGGPETYSGKETAHLGTRHNLLYSGASRAGMASAHSATPPPPSTPKSPSPDPGATLQGDTGGEDIPRRRQQAQGASPLPSGTVQHRTGRKPGHGPFVPGHVGPALTQQLYRTILETLHKHLETRLKIMSRYPRTHKT
jgi:hypothetical protein